MKKSLLFALLIAATFTMQAQENIVKASLLFGNAGIQYERAIGKHFSLAAQAGYAFLFVDDYKMNQFTEGYGYYFEGRYYFSTSKGKMQGWHIGPSVNILETQEGKNTVEYQTSIFGLKSGSQWVYNSHLTFEFIVGAGYMQTSYKNGGNNSHLNSPVFPVFVQAGVALGYAF